MVAPNQRQEDTDVRTPSLMPQTIDQLVARHRASGRIFTAAGVRSFALDAGAPDADYTWGGLGRWLLSAVDALQLDRFHLVVHDIGGPIGFETAAAAPDRVRSLTLLNTTVAVASFHRPWMMEPFAHPGLGEAWLAAVRLPGVFVSLMRYTGVSTRVSAAEIAAYVPLLLGDDSGRAFLQIMRGFELTADKQRRYVSAVRGHTVSGADRLGSARPRPVMAPPRRSRATRRRCR